MAALVLVVIGLIWVLAPGLPRPGRLPGDIVIERPNSRFSFPLTTCVVISLLLSLVFWLVHRLSR